MGLVTNKELCQVIWGFIIKNFMHKYAFIVSEREIERGGGGGRRIVIILLVKLERTKTFSAFTRLLLHIHAP